ncbi:MAG: hypothetical protein KA354_19680 [Phycisphaerae bacterium]|nr:hypothetical protein [Phycisphaerae bacterium]
MTSSGTEPAGERRFRSWGEAQIARCLDRYRIPYLYEHPLAVVDRGKTRVWYPDFQLCRYGMLIEYCGRVGDPDYAAGMARKQTVYDENGLTALMLTQEDLRGNWPGRILGRIDEVLEDRLTAFRAAASDLWPSEDVHSASRLAPSGPSRSLHYPR